MADTIKTNLGPVTAYADAKAHGYTGTRDEFGQLLAGAAGNLQDAVAAKEGAEAAKQSAETAQKAAAENQKNAETQAENAKASADTAAGQAAAAKESATGAANSASAAQKSEISAGLSATAASNAKAAAKQAQQAAETAKTDAEAAKTAAGTSADAAAASAADAKKTLESIPDDYSTLSGKVDENTSGIRELKEEFSPLYKKKIGCAGDSICYGNGYVGGYAKIIGENNGMTVQNLGIGSTYLEMEVAGSTVITCVNGQRTTWTTLTKGTFDPSLVDFSLTDDYGRIRYAKREWTSKHQYVYTEITQSEWNGTDSLYIFRRSIPERVQYFDSDCDYIIMEGGINDVSGGLYLGEITEGFASELDTHTVLGGTEQMCRNLLARFAGKKLGFILIHKVLQLPFTSPPNADGTQKLYFDKIKEVLNKYSIPVLDLYNESGLNTGIDSFLKYTLATSTNPNGDGIHPNEEGYRKFYVQKIEAWLKSL